MKPIYSTIKTKLANHPKWKSYFHSFISSRKGRPRWWLRKWVNPWYFHRGRGSWIRPGCIMNISSINHFSLGDYSGIEEFMVIDNGAGSVSIGDHTLIGLHNTLIGPLQIGNQVVVAQNVVMSGLNHCCQDTSTPIRQQGVSTAPIVIANDVWIGANVSILAGVNIGEHAVVGAGSVVTKDAPPYTFVVGNPVQVIHYIS